MKISEVVRALLKLKRVYGDLEVLHSNDWTDFVVDEVELHDVTEPGWHEHYARIDGYKTRSNGVGGFELD